MHKLKVWGIRRPAILDTEYHEAKILWGNEKMNLPIEELPSRQQVSSTPQADDLSIFQVARPQTSIRRS